MFGANDEIAIRLRLLSGGFEQSLRRGESMVGGFAQRVGRITSGVARAAGQLLDRVSTPGAIAGSLGGAAALRRSVEQQQRLAAIAANADLAAGQVAQLHRRLSDVAGVRSGQTVSELTDAVDALLAKDSSAIGDILDTDLMDRLGRTATATGSDITELVESYYQLRNAFGLNRREALEFLGVLTDLGKEGAFELRDMAAFLPSIGANFARIGQTGEQGARRAAAALQVLRRDTASASEAATNLENAVSYLSSDQARRRLGELGIDVFNDRGQLRDLFDLLAEIRAATDGGANTEILSRVFTDKQARDGVISMLRNFEDLQRLSQTTGGDVIDRDFATVTNTTAAALKALREEVSKLADQELGPWAVQLGNLARFLAERPHLLRFLGGAAATLVGVGLARRGLSGLGGLASAGAGVATQAAGLGLVATGRAAPVFVVNWPGGPLAAVGGVGGASITATAAGAVGGGLLRRGLTAGAGGIGALLTQAGFGGVAATGATGVGAAGLGTVGLTVGGGLLAGGAVGTGINALLGQGVREGLQNGFARLASLWSEDARNLVEELRAQRQAQQVSLQIETSPDVTVRELQRGG